jgi:hypothetical protein
MYRAFGRVGRPIDGLGDGRADESIRDRSIGARDFKIPSDMRSKNFNLVAGLVGARFPQLMRAVGSQDN